MGRLHFPGFSAEAAQFLIEQRQIRGLGLDTLSVDYGLSRDFAVHHVLGKAGRYGLENLANLEQAAGARLHLFVAPIKIETGSGGPVRVFATWAKSADDGARTPRKVLRAARRIDPGRRLRKVFGRQTQFFRIIEATAILLLHCSLSFSANRGNCPGLSRRECHRGTRCPPCQAS